MNELTNADIDRMCREMVDRFRQLRAMDETDASCTMARIMAEYPPAVGWCYVLLTNNQIITGRVVVHAVPGKRRTP